MIKFTRRYTTPHRETNPLGAGRDVEIREDDIWVNPLHVAYIREADGLTRLTMSDGRTFDVTTPPVRVASLIRHELREGR